MFDTHAPSSGWPAWTIALALTLCLLVALPACDVGAPAASPTSVVRALSPAPASTAMPTTTPTPRPTVTPTREPTMTLWPTYTASPTRTPTQTPTPVPTPIPAPIHAANVARVGHMEGPAHVVCVQGNRAYVGAGPDLEVLDVSDPAHPRLAGRVTLPYTVLDVCVSGSYAYVAAGSQGLYVMDVSDPANPIPVGVYDDLACAYAVAVSDSHVYVAAGPAGLHVVDMSDPTTPTPVGTLPIPGTWTHHVAVSDRPSAGSGQAHAYVAGYDYEADQVRWQVVDVSNPAAPAMLGVHDLPGWAWGAAAAGDRIYVADGRRGGLRTLDVADPATPAELGFYHTWERRVYDVAVVGNMAYVAAGPEGLRVLDVSNPAAVVEVGYYDTAWDAVAVATTDGLVYVADRYGLEILRVASSPIRPSPTATPVPTPTATPRIVSISPDEIEARISRDRAAALPAIWRELGLGEDTLLDEYLELYRRLEREDLKLGTSTYVVLRLRGRRKSYCSQLLFFAQKDKDWQFLGLIDLGDVGRHRTATIGEQGIWCIVSKWMGGGTDVARYDEQWYRIGGPEPQLTLQYPRNGHAMLLPNRFLYISYKTETISYDQIDGVYVVDVWLTISFGFFSTVRQAHYVWDSASQRFVLDPMGSEMSQKEVEDIEIGWAGSSTEFIRRYFEEVVQPIMDSEEWQLRNWLMEYLESSPFYHRKAKDVPEKRALLAILDARP